ncbi:MAG: SDR family oxidoreductase [Candidatus Nitricoxidivorans perseverans]|uniref:dTDP-4-dehydrorhamnose reductase n=1 Tax=Candidatus Nitricoxidivorans perseverans TaxID=2975601 RepID=A0AA49FKL0_9PROT|nr:MAG: SDR family oxidoreductase [Candidatus Nitricoxidivorans perseverans]
MKILVLGANGMIGSTMIRVFSEIEDWDVAGTVRSDRARLLFPVSVAGKLVSGVELSNPDSLPRLFREVKPDVVVNCAGLTKHLPAGNDPMQAMTMNAMLPRRLSEICGIDGTRLIHVSTDCVFSGRKGNYSEDDPPDAEDVYGRSKHMGEVTGPNIVTLRTSTIGHELGTCHGLLEWFLAQSECKGYRRAIFSGLPTVVFARVVRDIVIPNEALSGLYHVGARPIDKDSLLRLIARAYGRNTTIVPDDEVSIDRSLNVDRFAAATGYRAPEWPELIETMRAYH